MISRAFNDYEGHAYQNVTLVYEDVDGTPTPKSPPQPAKPEYEEVLKKTIEARRGGVVFVGLGTPNLKIVSWPKARHKAGVGARSTGSDGKSSEEPDLQVNNPRFGAKGSVTRMVLF